jgi:predicted transcriptional regulator
MQKKSIEERVYEALRDFFPQPVLAEQICKKVRVGKPAVAAVLQRLYEKDLIVPEDGGFLVKYPEKYRSIDAGWGV